MKQFIVGWAIVLLSLNWLSYKQDNYMHQEQMLRLKRVCQEAAVAGAQYFDKSQYRYGKYVFNQSEGTKAVEEIIKYNLKLDNNFVPLANTYWQDKITYTITFLDDSNTVYPLLYTDPSGMLTHAITSPTVVIAINAGKTRYRLITNPPTAFRVSAHAWKTR
ncbi:hypothetical protein [Clostridium sp.]|uniref:hypothetical protein n=1 Tax=Clostridium sp. TaxID=1506 RepID=UPI001A423EB2|nr:hypothetical protein [Clostridium sp.]MBK5235277.1 hypothetical protein [Clostridium sp.]